MMKVSSTIKIAADDDGLDEAMQYKNQDGPLKEHRLQKKNKKQQQQQVSVLRPSSARSSLPYPTKSFSTSRVSFSDGDDGHNTAAASRNNISKNKSSSKLSRTSSLTSSFKKGGKTRRNETRNGEEKKIGNGVKESCSASETHSTGSRRWNIGKRFSLFGSGDFGGAKRKNGYGTLDDDLEDHAPEADPVMTIFESRNTQRVRFTLEGADGDGGPSSAERHDSRRSGVDRNGSDGGNSHDKYPQGVGAGNIKQFMSRALFGSSSRTASNKKLLEEEMAREVQELGDSSLIWESATTPTGPEVIHTHNSKETQAELLMSFTEDEKARGMVTKLLSKARRAEHVHFRYEYAVKCYLKALNILKKAKYPDDHPTVTKTVRLMNNAHHVLSSYNNSANIVKMGIKNEDNGELVKALKMYTIAYRIRRDNLSRNHPSLAVLLNMLGSIQIKRGELKEAMQIYELALNDAPVIFSAASEDSETESPVENLLARSVTYREMGTIHEMWGDVDEALNCYHKSLECVAEWRETVRNSNLCSPNSNSNVCGACDGSEVLPEPAVDDGGPPMNRNGDNSKYSIRNVRPMSFVRDSADGSCSGFEHGGMELVFGPNSENGAGSGGSMNPYERFFPSTSDDDASEDRKMPEENSHADMDLALTLHQIAQMYKAQGSYGKALDAYEVALRGMRTALGKHHPNVAAVLGNIGNLQKEMGDFDAAYQTYQEVLGIESYRLGLSHPDVAITLHNIAVISAAKGNYEHSLQLYRKVIGLQKKLFGEDNLSVAVTAACMGDVYEKIGELGNSMDSFDEAVRIKSAVLGRHSLDVGRLLHKLGKLSFLRKQYINAESYTDRAILIYRLNKLSEDHEWFVDAARDTADIDAAIAMRNPGSSEI